MVRNNLGPIHFSRETSCSAMPSSRRRHLGPQRTRSGQVVSRHLSQKFRHKPHSATDKIRTSVAQALHDITPAPYRASLEPWMARNNRGPIHFRCEPSSCAMPYSRRRHLGPPRTRSGQVVSRHLSHKFRHAPPSATDNPCTNVAQALHKSTPVTYRAVSDP